MNNVKNILDALDRVVPAKNKHIVIESRAVHLIASVQNLCQLIKENYPDEQANDLIKRLYRSMSTGDDKKFTRRIKDLKDPK